MTKYPSQMQDKFNLRFPDGMRDAVADRARRNGRSMNSEIIEIISNSLFLSEADGDAVGYVLELAKNNDYNALSKEDRCEAHTLLMQMAQKLATRIENEGSQLRQILDLLNNSDKKPT